ncbi:MAG: hypothetical protein ACM3UX_00665 [Candidatus Woesearchaeota archaeon]
MDLDRHLPSALSDHQREALAQFLSGHLSAGQFSQRLSYPTAAEAAVPPVAQRSTRLRRLRRQLGITKRSG